jgi:hypothetical protein
MGVVQLGGGLVLYTRASRHLPAAELRLVATAELVPRPLWVWIGVGEAQRGTLVGGGLVILAIWRSALGARERYRALSAEVSGARRRAGAALLTGSNPTAHHRGMTTTRDAARYMELRSSIAAMLTVPVASTL